MIQDDGSVVSTKSDAKPVESVKDTVTADVLSSIDEALIPEKMTEMPSQKAEEKPAEPVAEPVAVQNDIAPAKPESGDAESLLSAEASVAAASSIKKLKSAEPGPAPLVTTPSPHFTSGNSVEGMVAEMLRPMMKSWLDANLPQIVERIVEREVKKLTKYLTDKGE